MVSFCKQISFELLIQILVRFVLIAWILWDLLLLLLLFLKDGIAE